MEISENDTYDEKVITTKKIDHGKLYGPVAAGLATSLAAAALTVTPLLTSRDETHSDLRDSEIRAEQDKIMTGEDLEKAHIHIFNTNKNQLQLKKSVINNIDLFKDAKDGKISEVDIVLLDGTMDLATIKVPEIADHALGFIDPMRRQSDKMVGNLPIGINSSEVRPDTTNRIGQYISFADKELNTLKMQALLGNTDAQKEYDLKQSLINSDSQLQNRVFIFLAMGVDKGMLSPDKSYPQPEKIATRDGHEQERPTDNPDQEGPHPYSMSSDYMININNAGMSVAALHEVLHYKSYDEGATDRRAYWAVKEAFDKQIKTGSSEDYGFIFKTPQGTQIG